MKNINKFMLLIFLFIFSITGYASSKGKSRNLTETQYHKWFKSAKIYVLLENSVECNNPKDLAEMYNNILAKGGSYNPGAMRYENHFAPYSTDNNTCDAIGGAVQLHIKTNILGFNKTFYHGKIVKVDYVRHNNHSTLFLNRYVLVSQLYDKKRYNAEFATR
jgi:hypothetical protein